MKKVIFMIAAAVVLSTTACSDGKSPLEKKTEKAGEAAVDAAKEGVKEAEKAADNAMSDAKAKTQLAKENMTRSLNEGVAAINTKVEEMDKKMAKANRNEKKLWETRKKKLMADREELKTGLKDMGSEMKDGWEKFSMNVNSSLERIKKDMDDK